jgi:hypothetical protein
MIDIHQVQIEELVKAFLMQLLAPQYGSQSFPSLLEEVP